MADLGPVRRLGADRVAGLIAGATGLAASTFVLFGPVVSYTTTSSAGTTTSGTISGIDYLFGSPAAQVELFAWPVLLGAITVVGAAAAWRRRYRWTLAAGIALAAFTVVGLMTLGLLYGPAALLMLLAGVLGRDAG